MAILLAPTNINEKNSRVKNIGFLLGSLAGAGAEKTIITLAKHMVKLGHQVHLFVLSTQADYQPPENVTLHLIDGDSQQSALECLLQKADAVGSLDLFVTSRPDYYDERLAKRVFCSVHITPTAWLKKRPWFSRWKTWLQIRKLSHKYRHKKLIALSEGIKHDLVMNLGCRSNDIQVINNPFELDEIRKKAEAPGLLPSQPYIIYVAAMIARKRHADLLQAFAQLEDKAVNLVLVGKGEEEANLKTLSEKLKIADRVIFWGWDANPYRLIKNAKISVLVSEAEGLPRVLIESIALGVPVVSTDCPSGPNEVLVGENAKFLVKIGDVNGLVGALNHLLVCNTYHQPIELNHFDSMAVAKKYLKICG